MAVAKLKLGAQNAICRNPTSLQPALLCEGEHCIGPPYARLRTCPHYAWDNSPGKFLRRGSGSAAYAPGEMPRLVALALGGEFRLEIPPDWGKHDLGPNLANRCPESLLLKKLFIVI